MLCSSTGYRLPTEAEWEYACRSGTDHQPLLRFEHRPAGAVCSTSGKQQGSRLALPCGSLLPNDLGLFDMLGNVWEWCQDRYVSHGTDGTKRINNPIIIHELINDKSPRFLRGGAFDNPAALVRSANRYRDAPAYRIGYYGFRPSRTYP